MTVDQYVRLGGLRRKNWEEDAVFLVARRFWPFTADKSVELLEQDRRLKQKKK